MMRIIFTVKMMPLSHEISFPALLVHEFEEM